jgi:GTPase SAR1 family protein
MKVVCIDNNGYERWLTLGKTYEVISDDGIFVYNIINDRDQDDWCNKKWFKLLSEIRNEKINKLLEE